MGLLETIKSPADLKALPAPRLDRARRGDPRLPRRVGVQDRRPPRPQPRRRRADHRAAPGLRLARATRSSSTPATSPTSTSCSPAGTTSASCEAGRPVRLPQPRRVRARRRRELARLHRPVLGRRHRQGPPPHRASATGTPSRSSATARSPAAWPGRRSTTSPPTRTCRSSSSSTTTSAPTRRPSAASPTTSRRCARRAGYERFLDWGKSTLHRTPGRRAARSTRRCTA